MTYEEQKKKLETLATCEMFSRDDLLFMIDILADKIPVEGFSTVLNWKESLGFQRFDNH